MSRRYPATTTGSRRDGTTRSVPKHPAPRNFRASGLNPVPTVQKGRVHPPLQDVLVRTRVRTTRLDLRTCAYISVYVNTGCGSAVLCRARHACMCACGTHVICKTIFRSRCARARASQTRIARTARVRVYACKHTRDVRLTHTRRGLMSVCLAGTRRRPRGRSAKLLDCTAGLRPASPPAF